MVPGASPDFLCIGAQRAGTTWLYGQLAAHPDFWMPPRKELHYLNERGHHQGQSVWRRHDERDRRFREKLERLGTRHWLDLTNYGQLFAEKGARFSGDITPAYSMLAEEVIALVMQHYPKMKVIFFARDPVERAWSQVCLALRTGGIAPFDSTNPATVLHHVQRPLVLMRSYPSLIAARWKRYVPAAQFGLFFFDDLLRAPADLSRAVLTFLGANPEKGVGRSKIGQAAGKTKGKLPLSDDVRAEIAGFFAEELKRCAGELGGPAEAWPDRYGS